MRTPCAKDAAHLVPMPNLSRAKSSPKDTEETFCIIPHVDGNQNTLSSADDFARAEIEDVQEDAHEYCQGIQTVWGEDGDHCRYRDGL